MSLPHFDGSQDGEELPAQLSTPEELLPEQPAITLHYATGWQQPRLHGSLVGGQWQDFPMQQVLLLCGFAKRGDCLLRLLLTQKHRVILAKYWSSVCRRLICQAVCRSVVLVVSGLW